EKIMSRCLFYYIIFITFIGCGKKSEHIDLCPKGFSGINCSVKIGDSVKIKSDFGVFEIDVFEVTVDEYENCVKSGYCDSKNFLTILKCNYSSKNRKLPMNCITLNGAKEYCKWKNKRVPTAQEWSFAAKAGENYKYSGGDNPKEVAWFRDNCNNWNREAKTVGTKKPNRYGLYDMSGNVAEWSVTESARSSYFLVCGGDFWSYDSNITIDCREKGIFHTSTAQNYKGNSKIGFRCVKSIFDN
ncbi:SUMF1/EgtB/PvdO family nonheme iron enzyme, partial [bacterium]|nr:SUMF1/EgtB/PvdO family nonheme iron enzyme [bacterium]